MYIKPKGVIDETFRYYTHCPGTVQKHARK